MSSEADPRKFSDSPIGIDLDLQEEGDVVIQFVSHLDLALMRSHHTERHALIDVMRVVIHPSW